MLIRQLLAVIPVAILLGMVLSIVVVFYWS